MRVSDLGRKQVHPLHFWVAVTFAIVLLLVSIGIPFMQTGHVPVTPHWATAALVAFVWGASAWAVVRQGRAALPLQQVVWLVGVTLFFGSDLVPSLGRASWVKDVGCLLFLGSMLSQWVEFGKRRPPRPTMHQAVRPRTFAGRLSSRVERRANQDSKDNRMADGALHDAAIKGNTAEVVALLDYGADVNTRYGDGAHSRRFFAGSVVGIYEA